MIFKVEDKVVVVGTGILGHLDMRGTIGYVHKELFPFVNETTPVYLLRQDKDSDNLGIFENKHFRATELVLMERNNDSDFDFTKYLTEQQVTAIAEKVCEKQVTAYVDKILENRTWGGGSIVDQMLHAAVKLYAEKLSNKFEDDFLTRCKEEIHRNIPVTVDECTFRNGLSYALQNEAKKYIESNSELIQSEMKDIIHDEASMLSTDKVAWLISQKINIKDIIMQVIKEDADKPKPST
jgi:hypothetical protein